MPTLPTEYPTYIKYILENIEFKFIFPVPSLYLDDLGQDSVGLRKLVYVKLNKERLLKLEKSFLTGEFLNMIRI